MDNVSVIIPTIQKNLTLLNMLVEVLLADKSVSEIFIINNKIDTPLKLQDDKKIKIYTPKENLFVNASWNYGISQIKNENFALINDDIIICKNLCTNIITSDIFNYENTGLIGLDMDSVTMIKLDEIKDIKPAEFNDNYSLIPTFFYHYMEDWGSVIFGKKKNYYKIPDLIKIICGDNYLLFKNLINAKINYKISGITTYHCHSLSSNAPEFNSVVDSDSINSYQCICLD